MKRTKMKKKIPYNKKFLKLINEYKNLISKDQLHFKHIKFQAYGFNYELKVKIDWCLQHQCDLHVVTKNLNTFQKEMAVSISKIIHNGLDYYNLSEIDKAIPTIKEATKQIRINEKAVRSFTAKLHRHNIVYGTEWGFLLCAIKDAAEEER